jgi:hypothetical protein
MWKGFFGFLLFVFSFAGCFMGAALAIGGFAMISEPTAPWAAVALAGILLTSICWMTCRSPSAGVNQGDLAYAKDTLKLSKRDVGVWTNTGGGAVAWGAITGTLSAQTDLQTELDAKAATTRPLNQFGSPDASVQFAQQQALQFRMENRTTDPVSPAVGEMWFRTDL